MSINLNTPGFSDEDVKPLEELEGIPASVDDDSDDSTPADPDPDKLSRREKKQRRYDEFLQEERSSRKIAEERAHMAEIRALQAEQRYAEVERQAKSRFEESATGGIDKEIGDTYQKKITLLQSYNALAQSGKLSETDNARYLKESSDLDDRQFELRAKKHALNNRESAPNATAPATSQNPGLEFIRQKHFDVVSDQRALQYANGRFQTKMATLKKAPNEMNAQEVMSMVDTVMDEARVAFKMQPRTPTDSAGSKQRLSGFGNDYGGNTPRRTDASLTKEEKIMARAAYSYLGDEELAFKAFRKNVLNDKR